MRYTVDSIVPFLDLTFVPNEAVEGEPELYLGHGALFVPWSHTITRARIVELECREHHRVTSRYDAPGAVPAYDGFIFVCPFTGERWQNQYPRAQHSTYVNEAPYIVSLQIFGPTAHRKIHAMRDAANYVSYVMSSVQAFKQLPEDQRDPLVHHNRVNELTKHLESVMRLIETSGYTHEVASAPDGQFTVKLTKRIRTSEPLERAAQTLSSENA